MQNPPSFGICKLSLVLCHAETPVRAGEDADDSDVPFVPVLQRVPLTEAQGENEDQPSKK